jgi:hypothetical protein
MRRVLLKTGLTLKIMASFGGLTVSLFGPVAAD